MTRSEKSWGPIFAYYGRECSCCGETEPALLHIHHRNGDVPELAAAGKKLHSYALREWIIKYGFPAGYCLLCTSCHRLQHHPFPNPYEQWLHSRLPNA